MDRIVGTLSNIKDGFNQASFGVYSAKTCENLGDPILCERLISPSASQRAFAKNTLFTNMDKLRAAPERALFNLVPGPLFQTSPTGEKFQVNALAELGGSTVIIDSDSLRGETVPAQLATLTHEFLHLANKNLDDFSKAGDWMESRQMLDFIGAATAAHYVDNLGKTIVTFPQATDACYGPGARNALEIAPFYQPPVEAGDPDGQFSETAKAFVRDQIRTSDFTIAAWVKVDPTDLEDRDAVSNGEVIFSHLDQKSHNGYLVSGLVFFRYSLTKTFAAYGGTYELLDSGIKLDADGKYHHLVLKRDTAARKYSTFVDGVAGLEYSDMVKWDVNGDPIYASDPTADKDSESEGNILYQNPFTGPVNFGIGRAGGNPLTNNCTLSGYKDTVSVWECLRRFTGNIAAIHMYKAALSAEKISELYKCGIPAK